MFVRNTVKGININFVAPPVQNSPPKNIPFSSNEEEIIDNEVYTLLQKGAITHAQPCKDQFLSNIFVRPKKNGKMRPIINLKGLNKFLVKTHFKMEHLLTILPLLQKDAYMTSLDLTDAYFTLPIADEHRKYLRFAWRGELFEFTCLCFGLSSAPYLFTKVMKPVFSNLRKRGISCTYYLDDSLYINMSSVELVSHTREATILLESLGFKVNVEKSLYTPSQEIQHLGFILNTVTQTVSLPSDKINRIKEACQNLLNSPQTTIRGIAKTIGLLVSSFMAVKHGQLHYRHLEIFKTDSLHRLKHYDAQVSLSENAKLELEWWLNSIDDNNGRLICDILHTHTDKTNEIFTDASSEGWGAVLYTKGKKHVQTGGRWSASEKKEHINFLELKAIHFALLCFGNELLGSQVTINSDNTSAVSYINKYGGCRSKKLNNLSREIWLWCIEREIVLLANHIPGCGNVTADHLSRNFCDNIEWSLNDEVFLQVCEQFGYPTVDLFASRLNSKLSKYFSWKNDPFATAVNAFSQSWDNLFGYAFPPFNLISKVISKVRMHDCTIILICPLWASQPWFPSLAQLFVDFPVQLPSSNSLLRYPTNQQMSHPLLPKMTLIACKLSNNSCMRETFHRKLSKLSTPAGNRTPAKITSRSCANGSLFVTHGTLIPLYRL